MMRTLLAGGLGALMLSACALFEGPPELPAVGIPLDLEAAPMPGPVTVIENEAYPKMGQRPESGHPIASRSAVVMSGRQKQPRGRVADR